MSTITITPIATFRTDDPYPFCPGCGHGPILDRLNEAMIKLDLDPARVVIVSDIGCSGLSDQYFNTSAFHGLHGRSITYATGIKLANPDLEVIVIMGDGGTGIGGAHLLSAARRNIGITVIVIACWLKPLWPPTAFRMSSAKVLVRTGVTSIEGSS